MKKMLIRNVACAALTLSPVALGQDAAPEIFVRDSAAPAGAPVNKPLGVLGVIEDFFEPAAPAGAPVNKPSADAVKDTWEYFYKGQGQGPILVETRLCTDVAKTGPEGFKCTEVDPAAGVKAGTSVMLWQAYLVPQGDSIGDLVVQVKHGTAVRETKDVKVKGDGWRARHWTGVRLNKAGNWTVSVMRGDETLKEIQVKVN